MGILEYLLKMFMGCKNFNPNTDQELNGRFGSIPGIDVFATWETRDDMRKAGMHIPTVVRIAGNTYEGAYSIVMNGSYDDSDEGDFISYMGACGSIGKIDSYGSFKHPHNQALRKSVQTGRPVRVLRGASLNTKYAPKTGFRYDGLYRVIRTYEIKGREGYTVCKFDMTRLADQPPLPIWS